VSPFPRQRDLDTLFGEAIEARWRPATGPEKSTWWEWPSAAPSVVVRPALPRLRDGLRLREDTTRSTRDGAPEATVLLVGPSGPLGTIAVIRGAAVRLAGWPSSADLEDPGLLAEWVGGEVARLLDLDGTAVDAATERRTKAWREAAPASVATLLPDLEVGAPLPEGLALHTRARALLEQVYGSHAGAVVPLLEWLGRCRGSWARSLPCERALMSLLLFQSRDEDEVIEAVLGGGLSAPARRGAVRLLAGPLSHTLAEARVRREASPDLRLALGEAARETGWWGHQPPFSAV